MENEHSIETLINKITFAANLLYNTVLNPKNQFPNLDDEPKSFAKVNVIISEVQSWVNEISNVFGSHIVFKNENEGYGLLKHFDFSGPGSAEDLLGPIPDKFRPPRHGFEELTNIALNKINPDCWLEIKGHLIWVRKIISAKSLGLSIWVKNQIQELENVLRPTVTLYRNSTVTVEIAGKTRKVEATTAHYNFLKELSKKGVAKFTRSYFPSISKKIPELRHHIYTNDKPRISGANTSDFETNAIIKISSRKKCPI